MLVNIVLFFSYFSFPPTGTQQQTSQWLPWTSSPFTLATLYFMKLPFFFNALFFSDQKAIYLQVVLLKQKNTNRRASLVAQR